MAGQTTNPQFKFFKVTLSPASVAANTTAEQLFTVTGVEVGEACFVVKPTNGPAGVAPVAARVSAANQIGITFGNFTGGALVPTAAEVYLVCTYKE